MEGAYNSKIMVSENTTLGIGLTVDQSDGPYKAPFESIKKSIKQPAPLVKPDGSIYVREERPFVYVDEKGNVVAYFLACMPDTGPGVIVVHPVDNYYPGKQISANNQTANHE